MPHIDMDKNVSGDPVPDGVYLCRIAKIRDDRTTKAGDEMWELGMVIVEGEYSDNWINDRLVFSSAAANRVRMALIAMGLPSEGSFDLEPEHLEGRVVRVEVMIDEYENNLGEVKSRNEVLFEGYGRASAKERKKHQSKVKDPTLDEWDDAGDPDSDLPF